MPKQSMLNTYGCVPDKITEDDFNDLKCFGSFNVSALIKSIDFLNVTNYWNNKSLFWGDYESNSITMEDSLARDIYIRIDLRKDYTLILARIITLLKENELFILNEELQVIKLDLDELIKMIG